ncbi:MAG: acyl-CoA dehydrogenase C-terminal domain-containing protein [Alphaproteobacteria bacterium]|nr:acyl-CoA dehydrogenase C-terminal domain-containing protein [Alphaproteobacteria bacterium]
MQTYRAPLDDFRFILHDVLEVDNYRNLPGFEELSPDLVAAILAEGAKFCEERLLPLNAAGDAEGCRYDDGEVTTPRGFKEAYDTYIAGGWTGLTGDPEYGGQGLPRIVAGCMSEMVMSSNLSFSSYPGLTAGAAQAILGHGTEAQKATYLPNLVSGRWSGTMNLTEPHCGTDLGLMRTRAEPRDDGTYAITGTKIFITAGEHDLTENIVHLVLARIAGAPEGIRGVSLFIVPKFLVGEGGAPGARNGLRCASIEHKMGINGSATCVMAYDGATGYLLGEAHKGMRAMFTMMNSARLAVGVQGLALSETAYQSAAAYARERRQGRAPGGPVEPGEAADPIIVHPDVRRMLLSMRAFNEGARALALWVGLHLDFAAGHPDARTRRDSEDLVGLLTPVVKACFTDCGFESVNLGLQCFGGAGYIRDSGMEQLVRDARISQIYEGANGIQALDLVGRKLPAHMGRALRPFFHPLDRFIQDHAGEAPMRPYVMPLAKSFGRLQQATLWIGEKGLEDPDQAAAAASDYLRMTGLVALGFMWARIAEAALDKLAAKPENGAFYETKLATGRYFMERTLPDTSSLLAKLTSGADNLMALDAAAF